MSGKFKKAKSSGHWAALERKFIHINSLNTRRLAVRD
jgi:hypothetical protein